MPYSLKEIATEGFKVVLALSDVENNIIKSWTILSYGKSYEMKNKMTASSQQNVKHMSN